MELSFLGGAAEVGRSALLVDDRLLIDYGMQSSTPPRYPVGAVDPEAVIVSHGHLDHVGAIPSLLAGDARPSIHWTPPTRDLSQLLAKDTLKLHGSTPAAPFTETQLQRVGEVSTTHGYREPFEVAGYTVSLFNAGHIPGSAHVLVDDGKTRLLYTGDFHTVDQRLVAGSTARPQADIVVTESTYADVDHPDRASVERQFVEMVRRTIRQGGTVVVPAFAIGRTQEILLICAAHDIDCYVDGMGTTVNEILRRYPGFVRNPDALTRAISRARVVDGRDGQRERLATEPTVIVTTSGMLGGGPAQTYVPAIADHPGNTVALTGYQVAGTPGRELLDTGRAELGGRVRPVSATVEQFDFSAHADRHGLRGFLDEYREATIHVVHGDATEQFAAELRADGFDARAPNVGETVG
ncbi:MAG: MBL fold metallo-hydrolase [Salinirussus sp.]